MFIIFNQNQEIRKSLNPRAFKLCGLRQLLLHQLLRQLHYIRRMNAEEDVQYLHLLLSGLDPTQGVMLLLRIFFTSTPSSRLCILMQCVSVTP